MATLSPSYRVRLAERRMDSDSPLNSTCLAISTADNTALSSMDVSMFNFLRLIALLLMALPVPAATILVFGDSLSAGYGLSPGQGWVTLLEHSLAPHHRVINGSVSGETTAGGLSRLPAALKRHHPDVVVLELGANDGLRGLQLTTMRRNLEQMIRLAQQDKAQVLLVGLILPPNYGPKYRDEFHAVYETLAQQYALNYVPRLMADFEADPSKFQSDGLHPSAEVQPRMMETVRAKLPLPDPVFSQPGQ